MAYVDGLKETIYTRSLSQAAQAQGSTQALAGLLKVPENTLLRWMAGTAQMPVRAFVRLIELLVAYEEAGGGATGLPGGADAAPFVFRIAEHEARCARCDGTRFVSAEPGAPAKYTSTLLCVACGEGVRHGELLVQLAREAVHHSKVMTAARMRREAASAQAQPAQTKKLTNAD